jgi:hypothetical protein
LISFSRQNCKNSGLILVNNLDLVVMNEDGIEYRSQTSPYPGQFDPLNNVEQIFLNNAPLGDYAIYVHGTQVAQASTQFFSVVLSGGGFTILPSACTQLNPICPNGCSRQGTCTNGRCNCTSPYFGVDCSLCKSHSNFQRIKFFFLFSLFFFFFLFLFK